MLSPTLSAPPAPSTENTNLPTSPSTRRRGLSYLRSLSSHSSANDPPEQQRSPRHFFQRSVSYNSEKNKPAARRRSNSKPNEPTSPGAVSSRSLIRVTSADNPPHPEENSSGDDNRQSRIRERATEGSAEESMARIRQTSSGRADNSADTNGSESAAAASAANGTEDTKTLPPTIRLFPHQDLRNGRQSLNFSPISRTLPSENTIIRVGRYSEREGPPVSNPTQPSDAPVGFKSKVVSRKHCEFSFVNGQWQVKDVASSSGTFLNHIRLSQPNSESKLFPVKDGDIIQLGIDFRGGEEMIFRCVKIRIECNRSWQKKPNNFNKTRRAQILGLTKDQPTAGQNSGECSICLGAVLPCQALFVAPCAHVWHYKCLRPMLEGRNSQYPQFQCPNCRAWADLEADVDMAEEDMDAWKEDANDTDDHLNIDQLDRPTSENGTGKGSTGTPSINITSNGSAGNEDATIAVAGTATPVSNLSSSGLLARRAATNPASPEISAVNGIDMPNRPGENEMNYHLQQQQTRTETPNAEQIIAGEGPLTPRNNAGPFVFDGSGGSAPRRAPIPGIAGIVEASQ